MSAKTGRAPVERDRVRRRGEAERRDDRPRRPRPMPSASRREQQRAGARVHRHARPAPDVLGELGLERGHLRSLRQHPGGEHPFDRGALPLAELQRRSPAPPASAVGVELKTEELMQAAFRLHEAFTRPLALPQSRRRTARSGDAGPPDPADPAGRHADDEGEVGYVGDRPPRRRRPSPSARSSPGRRTPSARPATRPPARARRPASSRRRLRAARRRRRRAG